MLMNVLRVHTIVMSMQIATTLWDRTIARASQIIMEAGETAVSVSLYNRLVTYGETVAKQF